MQIRSKALYERFSPKKIEPVLIPQPKIPPDLSSSFEESEPKKEQTRSWPAPLSFIERLEPTYFYKPNRPNQARGQSEMRAADSVPCGVRTGHTMVSTDELRVEQITQIYNGNYTQASGPHSNSLNNETNPTIHSDQKDSPPSTSQTATLSSLLSSNDVRKHQDTLEKNTNDGFTSK